MNNKSLDYYLSLDYPIEIVKIPVEDGGGYSAFIRQLGKLAFRGDGETREEAIKDLDEVKEILFEEYLEKGIEIPEPVQDEERSYSGRFVLRVPVDLHRELAEQAEQNQTTLNQYCVSLLSQRLTISSIQDQLAQLCQRMNSLSWSVQSMQYSFEHPASAQGITWEKKYGSQVA
ncbi:MAG TPA: toxin-antitoxin system HicB family antitoxin [bacterium]|nr:toxin-antitoxin system HicB family antitoxin [bacterium]HQJ65440.1 toxin-antitoxin system HicB family antitoxin [bacterium]